MDVSEQVVVMSLKIVKFSATKKAEIKAFFFFTRKQKKL